MQQVAHEPNHEQGLRVSKHIFVGNSRLVTALTHQAGIDTTEQAAKLYYYHADHLQSAQFITNAKGEKYEHIEYTPYGELWIEETAPGVDKLPFRFTGKELDTETGLYYYGARYLDPKYSRWLSGDPALGEYIPKAPIDAEAKKHNENLPGMGGAFNTVNLQVYHYAGNNPVKYIDPDGRQQAIAITPSDLQMFVESVKQTFSSVPTPLVVVGAVATGVIIADDYFDGAISEGIANGINFIADKTIEAGKWIGEKIAGLFSKGDKAKPKTKDKQEDKTNRNNEQLPKPKYPGDDPTKAPDGTEWRGKPGSKPGDKVGNYHNQNTGESYRPDLNHDPPIGPHWDYKDPNGKWYRIFPDGTVMEK